MKAKVVFINGMEITVEYVDSKWNDESLSLFLTNEHSMPGKVASHEMVVPWSQVLYVLGDESLESFIKRSGNGPKAKSRMEHVIESAEEEE